MSTALQYSYRQQMAYTTDNSNNKSTSIPFMYAPLYSHNDIRHNDSKSSVVSSSSTPVNDATHDNKITLPPITSIIEDSTSTNNNNNNNSTTPEMNSAPLDNINADLHSHTPASYTSASHTSASHSNNISPPLSQVNQDQHTNTPSYSNISPTASNVLAWDSLHNEYVGTNNNNMCQADYFAPKVYYQPQPAFYQPMQQNAYVQYPYYMQLDHPPHIQQQNSIVQQQNSIVQQQMMDHPPHSQQQHSHIQQQMMDHSPRLPQQNSHIQQQMMVKPNYSTFRPNYIPQQQMMVKPNYVPQPRKASLPMMPTATNIQGMNATMFQQFSHENDIVNSVKGKYPRNNSFHDLPSNRMATEPTQAIKEETHTSIDNIPSLAAIQTNLNIAKRLRKQCPVCGKICSRPSTLKTHYLSHSGDTPFKCTWSGCTKSFNVKSNMLRHLKSHQRKLQKELLKKEIQLRKAAGINNFRTSSHSTPHERKGSVASATSTPPSENNMTDVPSD
ncbi:hypothetical protein MOSE0_B03092 [Monosporozyma servazzii]